MSRHLCPSPYCAPPRLLRAAAGALLFLGAAAAPAQIATSQDCARSSSPAEEIACLRRALDQSQAALAQPPARSKRDRQAKGARTDAPVPPVAPATPAEQLGAEQVSGRRPAAASPAESRGAQAVVTAAETGPGGVLILRLDNGQVWQQAESTGLPLQLSDRRYPVEIVKSGFGGYRMRFAGLGRQIVVRRVQ